MAQDPAPAHALKKELRLRDLVQMQILLVVGVTWIGLAGRVGGTHLVFWIAAVLFFFLPSAAVITWCVRIWPQEGGVYQWTRHAFGPFAAFMSAWNFGAWALLTVANLGILSATSLSYSLGSHYAWMAESRTLENALNIGLFALILAVCIPGFGIGKYVSHFGTGVMILVNIVLIVLLFFHPHATPAHPHVSPQRPFVFGMPMLTVLTFNLFSKMAFNGLTGLEQVAVFAGETRDAARSILRSAWIAAPVIALIFILGTGSILSYTASDKIDLVGPVPQVLAAAFSGAGPRTGIDWGLVLGRAAILGLALTVVAQYALIVAETSRLPMVAGWDGIIPAWFTRLSPRFGTPVRSILLIVAFSILSGLIAIFSSSGGAQEAYQLIVTSANICYAIYYGMMLLIPIAVGRRFGKRAGFWVLASAVSASVVTVAATGFNLFPVVDTANPILFGVKTLGVAILLNAAGAAAYWRATTAQRSNAS